MTIKRTGARPPVKPAAKAAEPAAVTGTVLSAEPLNMASAKLTISIKRRLSTGEEVFIAPGIDMHCSVEDLDATQKEVTDRVNGWLTQLLEAYPDAAEDALDAHEEETETEEAEEEIDLDAVAKMGKTDLAALIEKHELEIEGAAKMKIAELREAVVAALTADEDGEADEGEEDGEEITAESIDAMSKDELIELAAEYEIELDKTTLKKLSAIKEAVKGALFPEEDEDADEEGEEDADEEGEEGEDDLYTEEELKAMKLADLQEITKEWGVDDPKLKKDAALNVKKAAYIKLILATQSAADEE